MFRGGAAGGQVSRFLAFSLAALSLPLPSLASLREVGPAHGVSLQPLLQFQGFALQPVRALRGRRRLGAQLFRPLPEAGCVLPEERGVTHEVAEEVGDLPLPIYRAGRDG